MRVVRAAFPERPVAPAGRTDLSGDPQGISSLRPAAPERAVRTALAGKHEGQEQALRARCRIAPHKPRAPVRQFGAQRPGEPGEVLFWPPVRPAQRQQGLKRPRAFGDDV